MNKQNILLKHNRLITFSLVSFLIIFSVYSFYNSQRVISRMVNDMGNQIAILYGSADERQFEQYQNIIYNHIDDLEAFLETEPSDEACQEWLVNMTNLMKEITGNEHIDVALVSKGILHAHDGTTGDITDSEAYKEAVEQANTPVFSDVFLNGECSGKNVRLMYINPDTKDGLVLKLFQESFQEMHKSEKMKEKGTYFLCDSQGNMLYYLSSSQKKHADIFDYTLSLSKQIDDASSSKVKKALTVKDMDGEDCRVYTYDLSNGWQGIVLIPSDTFYQSLKQITVGYLVIFAGFFIILLLFWYNNYQAKAYHAMKKKYENEQAIGQDLLYRSEHDPLTGLMNRNGYEKTTMRLLESKFPICLIILDVDNFKDVNDTYGHDIGDKVLLNTAIELRRCFRSEDCLARFGGDEFIILLQLQDLSDISFVEKKMKLLNDAFQHPSKPYLPRITISAGIAFSEQGFYPELFHHADDALYYVKEHGRNGFHIWTDTDQKKELL